MELVASNSKKHRQIYGGFWKRFRTERTTKPSCAKCSKESETRGEDDWRQSVDNVGRDQRQLVSNCMNMFL